MCSQEVFSIKINTLHLLSNRLANYEKKSTPLKNPFRTPAAPLPAPRQLKEIFA
jgi:hypothetical protein